MGGNGPSHLSHEDGGGGGGVTFVKGIRLSDRVINRMRESPKVVSPQPSTNGHVPSPPPEPVVPSLTPVPTTFIEHVLPVLPPPSPPPTPICSLPPHQEQVPSPAPEPPSGGPPSPPPTAQPIKLIPPPPVKFVSPPLPVVEPAAHPHPEESKPEPQTFSAKLAVEPEPPSKPAPQQEMLSLVEETTVSTVPVEPVLSAEPQSPLSHVEEVVMPPPLPAELQAEPPVELVQPHDELIGLVTPPVTPPGPAAPAVTSEIVGPALPVTLAEPVVPVDSVISVEPAVPVEPVEPLDLSTLPPVESVQCNIEPTPALVAPPPPAEPVTEPTHTPTPAPAMTPVPEPTSEEPPLPCVSMELAVLACDPPAGEPAAEPSTQIPPTPPPPAEEPPAAPSPPPEVEDVFPVITSPPPSVPVDEEALRREIREQLQRGLEQEISQKEKELQKQLDEIKAQARAEARAAARAQAQERVKKTLEAEREAYMENLKDAVMKERMKTEDEKLMAQLYWMELKAHKLDEMEKKLKKQDVLFRDHLAKLEAKSAQFYKATTESYQKGKEEAHRRFRRYDISPICGDLQSQILKCYRENTGKTLSCSRIASAYMQCVDDAKQNKLRTGG